MADIINFPNTNNKQVQQQQEQIQRTQNTLNTLLECKSFGPIPLLPQDIEVLAEFGDTMQFSPIVAKKLIQAMAKQLNQLHDEEVYPL